jgi:pilus assembly protein CpaB
MKAARLVVLGVAIAAGGFAAYLASRGDAPPAPAAVTQLDTVEVLIAANDLSIGQTLNPPDMQWQAWPAGAANASFIRKADHANAVEQFVGSIVRIPIAAGEPIRENKLIKAKGSGYMAAILPSGMRAISTEISAESGAGGFILPNDRVDVILTRKDREAEKVSGIESVISETILTDIRVLAIDQTVEEKNGQRVVVGKTATMELTPHQAETLAVSRQRGTMSLALRSLADADPARRPVESGDDDAKGGRTNMVRFGITTTTTTK